MLSILFSMVVLFPVWMGYGLIWKSQTNGVATSLLLGIGSIASIWTLIAFFAPLNIYTETITISIGLILFFLLKGHQHFHTFFINKSKNDLYLLVLTVFFIIGLSSGYPYILDHFGYYVPSIQWVSEVGLVKGIANLDLILGQMSVWHIFQAGFSNFSDPFLRINALLLIVYAIYIIEKKAWIHLCAIPILIAFTQSPSPDLPVIVISLIVLNEILHKNTNITFLFALSCLVCAIKPTAIWLPLFCLVYGLFHLKKGFYFTWAGGLITLLYCVKNIWTFGYPIFPMALIDFNINWQANSDILLRSSQLALEKTYDLQYPYQEIIHFSWQEKLINWLTLDGIKGIIHLIFILLLGSLGIFSVIKKEKIYHWLFLSILIKSSIVLTFSAQYRFFLDVFFVSGILLCSSLFNEKRAKITASVLGIISGVIFLFPTSIQKILPSFRLGHMMGKPAIKQIYEPLQYTYHQYHTFQLGNLKFHVSKNYPFSFDTPLPAISPSHIQEYLDIGIFPQQSEQGFIWKKLNSKEKKHLKGIIEKINSNSPSNL